MNALKTSWCFSGHHEKDGILTMGYRAKPEILFNYNF